MFARYPSIVDCLLHQFCRKKTHDVCRAKDVDVDESEKLRAELAAVEEAPLDELINQRVFCDTNYQVFVNQMELIKYHYLVNFNLLIKWKIRKSPGKIDGKCLLTTKN